MKTIIIIFFIVVTNPSIVYSQQYNQYIKKADSLYHLKDYTKSASYYSLAFKANGWKGSSHDRYNAACSWALSGNADSAFIQLNRIATKGNYTNYDHLISDPDLVALHADKRWPPMIDIVRRNKERSEANLNKPLVNRLDSILTDDQHYRQMIGDLAKKYGYESREMKNHWITINRKDSINLIKVKAILDEFGWLGPDVIGQQGNTTLFLVIQHSDQKTQEKYLPMMREAVKKGNASAGSLALLEDRVALGQGKKQIYGSQVRKELSGDKFYIAPIEDEKNVNKRRASVGLEPLEDYAKRYNIDYKVPQE